MSEDGGGTDPAGRSGDGGAETELSRDLGYFAVLTTASGTMIGAGIFILPGLAAANAGPAAALSFLIAGLIAAMATFSAAELATAMPRAGGPYFFVSRSMGPLLGTIVGLGAWLALMFKGGFALVGLGQYVRFFSPVPVLATAVAGGLLLILVNWTGAKVSGTLQNVIVVGLLAILGAFVGRGLFAVQTELLTPFFHFGWGGVLATTGLVFISYLGIVKAAAISEEVRDPGRNLPWGLLSSVLLVTVLYVVVMLIVTGVLPIEAGSDHPGIVEREAPLADAGALFLGAFGGAIVGVSGILATVSTGNAAILSSARFPFAMSRDGLMTPWLNQTSSRFKTPSRAIWVTGGTMLALVFLFDVEQLAKLGGTFGIIVFAFLNLAVLILRRAQPPWYDPSFKSPLYPFMQIVGAVAALALIPQMGSVSQVGALLFVLLGIVWYVWQKRVGEPVQPGYSLEDQLRRMAQQRSLERKRAAREAQEEVGEEGAARPRVLVELVPGAPTKHLLTIAAAVARRAGAVVDAVVLHEVPAQTALTQYRGDVDLAWLRKVENRLAARDVDLEFHNILTRNRDRAILALIDQDTETVLIDWHGPLRIHRLWNSHVDTVLREAPVRVGVLKHRGFEERGEVVVASGGGPYERTEVEMADAIAVLTGAKVTFLKVLPPDAPAERVRNAEEYLEGLREVVEATAEGRIVRGGDVAAALVEASRDADLLIMGASRDPRFRRTVFGSLPDRVAARSDVSVLVTKDPQTHGSWRRMLRDQVLQQS